MRLTIVLVCFLAAAEGLAAPPTVPAIGRVRNIVTDYGAGGQHDISAFLQAAIDEAGAAGGGTIVIPARAGEWNLSRPVLVGDANITIMGEGAGTRISGGGSLFLLGLKTHYPQALSTGHFPLTTSGAYWDKSVRGRHFGLRTTDGTVRASGYFNACPFAFGYKVQPDPSGNFWKDYARGTGKPTYWQNWPQYTINVAVRNNSAEPMKGTICGAGAGGISPEQTRGDITDPLTVWTIESEPATGKSLCFKFKTIDSTGKQAIQSLLLSDSPAGVGTHRICVQLDFDAGRCRAWYSGSDERILTGPVAPKLSGKLDLGAGLRLKALEYGAFQLGRVTGRMFSGSPAADGGDWTYCGLSLLSKPQYAVDQENDRLGAIQKLADGKAADDEARFFPASDPALISYLPLTPTPAGGGPSTLLVPYQNGRSCDGVLGYGFWLPERQSESIPGTITLRDMQLFANSSTYGTAIGIGEAQHVVLENIYEGGGGYHGVSGLPLIAPRPGGKLSPRRELDIRNCVLTGHDAALFAFDQDVHADNVCGGGGETMVRLVGCRGWLDAFIVTGFVASDYYVKLHAGQRGGALRIGQFCIDNEGFSFVPRKACFYAEPSMDDRAESARVSFTGTLYTGALGGDKAVVELADAPAMPGAQGTGVLDLDGVDLGANAKHPARCIVLSHSPRWTGRIRLAQTHWAQVLTHGIIDYDGSGPCGIISYHDDVSALPDQGSWVAGCHVFHIPGESDPMTGGWTSKTFRCVRGGTYGTPAAPLWEQSPAK